MMQTLEGMQSYGSDGLRNSCAEDGGEIQAELQSITGVRTVPQIFVAGEFIGGASDTVALHSNGGLVPKLDAAGIAHQ
jgi:glutaredoxin-related protein